MLSDAALVVLFDLAWRSERAFHTVYDIVAGLQQLGSCFRFHFCLADLALHICTYREVYFEG